MEETADLRQAWEEKYREIFDEVDDYSSITGLLGDTSSVQEQNNIITLNFRALDFKLDIEYCTDSDNFEFSYETELSGTSELDNIVFLYGKMLHHRLGFGVVDAKEDVIGMDNLSRGRAAAEYERFRVRPFLTQEMEGSTEEEMESVIDIMGGKLIEDSGADWAVEAEPINGVRIRIFYWNSEEGMAPGASITYGAELMDTHLPAEDMMVLTEVFVNRLVMCYRQETNTLPKKWVSLYG